MHSTRRTTLRLALAGALAPLAPWSRAQAPSAALPCLASVDQDGRPVQLALLRGRVVLVTFYAAGCAVCASELTLVREFQTANRARGFSAIVVSLDEREGDYRGYARLQQAIVAAPLQFPIVWRRSTQHQDSFGTVNRRPTHVLIDRMGREVLRREGGLQSADWDDIWLALA